MQISTDSRQIISLQVNDEGAHEVEPSDLERCIGHGWESPLICAHVDAVCGALMKFVCEKGTVFPGCGIKVRVEGNTKLGRQGHLSRVR